MLVGLSSTVGFEEHHLLYFEKVIHSSKVIMLCTLATNYHLCMGQNVVMCINEFVCVVTSLKEFRPPQNSCLSLQQDFKHIVSNLVESEWK